MSTQVLDLGDWGSAEELNESGFERVEPGQYHAVVAKVEVEPDTKTGYLQGVRVTFQVLAGTVEKQAGRTFDDVWWWPRSDSKDGGKFANKRLVKLATATGVLPKNVIGKVKQVAAPDWPQMEGRHVIVGVKHDVQDKYTHARVDSAGMAIWSLDDPAAAQVPRDAASIPPQAAAGQPAPVNAVSPVQAAATVSSPATDYSDL